MQQEIQSESLQKGDYHLVFPTEVKDVPKLIKQKHSKCKKFMIVMDTNINQIYGQAMINHFQQISDLEILSFIISPGETQKSMDNILSLLEQLFLHKFSRTDVLIGFGGGLVTDFSAFAASIYKRGMKYVSIPTTVLAMSDAAIGSKTGVNNRFGKNMIGSFYDPTLIVVCEKFLDSLDDRNLSNGISEVIKIAAMLDEELFVLLELNDVQSLRANPSILRKVIRRSMELKISIVSMDKFESDKRMILNYGHTIGHGIETASNESLLHGECVSIGIILANELALQKFQTSYSFTKRIEKLLVQYNLPIEVPKQIKNQDILFYMGNDKKMTDNATFQFIFVEEVGKVIYQTKSITTKEVLNVLSPSIKIGSTDFSKLQMFKVLDQIYFHFIQQKDDFVVSLAGSKSITNRALVLSALLDKEIELQNVLFAEDTEVMMNSLQTLGACKIQKIDESRIKVKGNGGVFDFENEREIYVNNSGTSARFLCSILSQLKPNQAVVMKCCDRMKERPIKDLIDALSDFLNFEYLEKENYLPFRVTKKDEFKGGDIHINSKVSSQFVTGILMAAPQALTPVRVILSQSDSITSETFIQMTYDMMKQFGANIVREKANIFKIENKKYSYNNNEYYIEPDAATASYDMAWAVLNKRKVTIKGFSSEKSLQGDLKFTEKLAGLGYTIEYNEVGVVIRGDLERKEATQTSFDFNDCTDTFITFCVILAALENDNQNESYKITNIANQRVKECDRIHAVCLNLKKFGIHTKEFEDGLEIYPNRDLLLQRRDQQSFILIECFKDHRLGMAFSQLGNFIENNNHGSFNIVLDEGNCVNKTFPGFFNHLKSSYGVASEKVHFTQEKVEKNQVHELNTIFFVGMRCSGKTTLSKKMSKLLNKEYLCMDDEIYKQFYAERFSNLSEGINAEGWETFRKNELQVLKNIIKENVTTRKYSNTIISCGGGLITIPEAREVLKKQKNVIWLRRDFSDIELDYQNRENTPDYLNTLKGDYELRRPLYEEVSHYTFNFPNYTFFAKSIGEKEYWGRVEKSLKKFIKSIFDSQSRKGGQDEYLYSEESHFLCMQYEDIAKLSFADLVYIQKNYHALEVRGDQFFENRFDLHSFKNNFVQLEEFSSVLSRLTLVCNKLTLIFTLRTDSEGGLLSKQKSSHYYQMINYMQKQNIFNYIDFEIGMLKRENDQTLKVVQSTHPLIISKHYLKHEDQQSSIQNTLQKMKEIMREQDILKLVLCSLTTQEELENIRRELISLSPKSIIIQLGKSGKLSRVQNNFLTPVYDAKFGPPTGQGQLQKSEIVQLRQDLNLSSSEKKFYIFGTDIKNSPSPLIHNTCFESLNLTNYHYQLAQIKSIEEIEHYLRTPDFLGATITMPFKQEVNKYVDYVIGDAKHIGIDLPVINTIVKLNSKLYGFNTDWYGILKPLTKQLSLNQHYLKSQKKYALVIGAGATTMTMVYCLNILGFQTLIYNRTYEKIEKFVGWNGVIKGFSDMDELVDYLKSHETIQLSVVASTIPGKVEMDYRDILFKYKPTIFDASYIPQFTPLIKAAQLSGCTTFVYGLDMLLYQGYLQNQIFTGKRVSRKHIKNTTENYYKKLHQNQI